MGRTKKKRKRRDPTPFEIVCATILIRRGWSSIVKLSRRVGTTGRRNAIDWSKGARQ